MNYNILIITPDLIKGGAETQLVKLACFLETEKNPVWILSLLPKPECAIAIDNPAVVVFYLKSWRTHFFSNILRLKAILKEVKPDLVIAFMFIAIIFARILKTVFDFTLVSSIRAIQIPAKWYIPFKMTSGLDDLVVYNAEVAKQYFEHNSLAKKKGVVINNAITVPEKENFHKNGIGKRSFQWISIAHFRPEKDYHTLFKAIALIKEKNFKVVIVGNLYHQTWPFQVIKDLGIENKVEILGYKSNSTSYLKDTDAFVLSSFTESMPNAVLEAMANEKPIVASAVGGVPGMINESGAGFCFPSGDEHELASLMVKVMEMPSIERHALAAKGRSYVETHYSQDKVMQKWLHIISDYWNTMMRV